MLSYTPSCYQIIENKYSPGPQTRRPAGDQCSGGDTAAGGESGGLETVDATLSEAASRDLQQWRLHDQEAADFCDLEGRYKSWSI